MSAIHSRNHKRGVLLMAALVAVVASLWLICVPVVSMQAWAADTDTKTDKPAWPVISKEVMSGGEWADATTAPCGDEVLFRIVSTVGENIDTFDMYPFRIIDELPLSANVEPTSIKVYVDGRDVTDAKGVSVIAGDSQFVVAIADVRQLDANKDSKISVEYPAIFDADNVQYGYALGNQNKAYAEFLKDPRYPDLKYETERDDAVVYTFMLEILKQDKAGNKPLSGAKFAIRTSDGRRILCKDGTWTSEYDEATCLFETNDTGMVSVKGLGPGTYHIVEDTAPQGYAVPEMGAILEVSADATSSKLEATVVHELAKIESVDASAGVISMSFANVKGNNTPSSSSSASSSSSSSSSSATSATKSTAAGGNSTKSTTPFSGKSYGLPTTGDNLGQIGLAAGVVAIALIIGCVIGGFVVKRRRRDDR